MPGPAPAPPAPPDPHQSVRAYGASLFTAGSPRRAYLERLLALVRTPQPGPQVVSVIAGRGGLGASTTAAGVARTLATVRDDSVALLPVGAGSVDSAAIAEAVRTYAFILADIGGYAGEATPQVLAASHRVVVVTGADRRATMVARLTMDRIRQVRPALASRAIIAVVCRSNRQFRRVSRRLGGDLSQPTARIVPIPPDSALTTTDGVDLARLRATTREAYLRLATALTCEAGAEPTTAGSPALAADRTP